MKQVFDGDEYAVDYEGEFDPNTRGVIGAYKASKAEGPYGENGQFTIVISPK